MCILSVTWFSCYPIWFPLCFLILIVLDEKRRMFLVKMLKYLMQDCA